MLKDFVHSTKPYHDIYLQDRISAARREADLREARAATRRIRDAVGQRLIAIGERLIEIPRTEQVVLDKAA